MSGAETMMTLTVPPPISIERAQREVGVQSYREHVLSLNPEMDSPRFDRKLLAESIHIEEQIDSTLLIASVRFAHS